MSYRDFFNGKRVTLMGLGLLGRGIGDAEFLAENGAILTVTDKKTKEELQSSLERLSRFPNIAYALGGHRSEDFRKADMVIKAAGVPLDSPYIQEARAAGVPVYMSTALFAQFAAQLGARIIGITGTRGKSTVTHLIHHGLVSVGKRAHLGGNVRGRSTLAMLPDIQSGDVCVLELDSWQLQGFGDLKMSPNVSVFTNLMLDHLNYYPDTDSYFSDKANIYRYQKKDDRLIVGRDVAERVRKTNPPIAPVVPKMIPEEWNLRMAGIHNRENASLAAEALRALGLSEEQVRTAVESFAPVEGRLERLADVRGVSIYNDNNATTPDATVAALRAFPGKRVVLIAGGADKKLPLEELVLEMEKRAGRVVLLPGTGTDRLKPFLRSPYTEAVTMQEAVEKAFAEAREGNVILFSPAFASFGLFKNEYDRNDQFIRTVQNLQ